MAFQSEVDSGVIDRRARYFLEQWGAWARAGDESRALGVRSQLGRMQGGEMDVPVEQVGELVEGVLQVLPAEMVRIAVLVYQKRRTGQSVRIELRVSKATYERLLQALKVGVYVGVEQKSLTSP